MSVFAGQSGLQTGAQLGRSDSSLSTNYHGSAPLNSSIRSDTWLPGTTGVDCKLVHGDRWQEISGKMTQDIDGDKTSKYGGAFSETYSRGVTRNMYGSVDESYYGLVDRSYSQHVEEHFMAGHTQQNDVEELEVRNSKAEVIQGLSWEGAPYKIDTVGIDLCVAGIKTDFATLLQLEFGPVGICSRAVLELGTSPIRLEYGGLTQEGKVLKSEMRVMKTAVGGLQTKVQALELSAANKLGPNQVL